MAIHSLPRRARTRLGSPVLYPSHCGGQFLVPQLVIARHKRWLYGKHLRSSRCLRLESGRFLATAKRSTFLVTAKRTWFLVTAKRSTGTVRGCSPSQVVPGSIVLK